MTRKQYSNAILDKNGGLHSRRALKSVQQAMTTHGLKKPILYQFILSGKSTKGEYQATIKRLIEHIRTKCKAEYVGAYEVGTEKGGLHCHMFIIVETLHHFPGDDLLNVSAGHFIARRIKRTGMSITIEPPKNTMHGGAMFARMDTPAKLANCIEWCTYILKVRSKDAVPGRETYFGSCHAANARKREAKRQKYRDALEKSSVPAAPQAIPSHPVDCSTGKDEEHSITEKEHDARSTTTANETRRPGGADSTSPSSTSTNTESLASGPGDAPSSTLERSRPQRTQDVQPTSSSPEGQAIRPGFQDGSAAGPADQTHQPITRSPGDAMTAADRYIASLYESAIGLRLDLDAMRRYLLERGIKRTPAQVVFDLDERFCFYGYASRHPAPAPVDLDAIDRAIDRMKNGAVKHLPVPNPRELVNGKDWVYNCLTVDRRSYTHRSTA